jgi:hypothetical protein
VISTNYTCSFEDNIISTNQSGVSVYDLWNKVINYDRREWIVSLMEFNAIFNDISIISWQSVLFVEEIGVPGENHRPAASHRQSLSHNVESIMKI